MPEQNVFPLCDQVREAAFALHRHLRHGHLERVYETGLIHRLHLAGVEAVAQFPLQVRDTDGHVLGDYFADILVDRKLIVEIKAARCLADEHFAQVLGYLRGSGFEHALLINFGSPRLEIRKLILSR